MSYHRESRALFHNRCRQAGISESKRQHQEAVIINGLSGGYRRLRLSQAPFWASMAFYDRVMTQNSAGVHHRINPQHRHLSAGTASSAILRVSPYFLSTKIFDYEHLNVHIYALDLEAHPP